MTTATKDTPKLSPRENEEIIRTKSKAKKAKPNADELKCEFPDCSNHNEDALIKCNACDKWICDTCSNARITKLKPIINSCSTLFFACRKCFENAGENGFGINTRSDNEPPPDGNIVPETLVASMKTLLNSHINQVETTIENMIEKKLNDKIPALGTEEPVSSSSSSLPLTFVRF